MWVVHPSESSPMNKSEIVHLPPAIDKYTGWDIAEYNNRWDIIEQLLT